jgi:glutamyl-tRNA reductase
MRLLMLGVNHRTAAVEVREKLALAGPTLDAMLDAVRAVQAMTEVVVLSTCNRTELYLARPAHEPPTFDDLRTLVATRCGLTPEQLGGVTIQREQQEAAAHLFRVCAGLESMVLGEPQILGQVKRAYEAANERGCVGPVLHRVFQQAIRCGKDVRSRTGIDAGRMSVGSVAVDFARNIFERFDDKTVVAVGAGEMMKLALRHFGSLTPGRLWLTNRTHERAAAAAAAVPRAQARAWDDLDSLLVEADVLLVCTGATTPILTTERFRPLHKRRRNRPLFIIDLGLPRDVEPGVGTLSNVYLYNLDDLQSVTVESHGQRSALVQQCEAMLLEQVRACVNAIQHQDLGQLVRQLRERLESLGRHEHDRTLRKLMTASPDDYESVLAEHTHRLINKILHMPLSQIDRRNADAPLGFYAAALRRLFALDEAPDDAQTPPTLSHQPDKLAARE